MPSGGWIIFFPFETHSTHTHRPAHLPYAACRRIGVRHRQDLQPEKLSYDVPCEAAALNLLRRPCFVSAMTYRRCFAIFLLRSGWLTGRKIDCFLLVVHTHPCALVCELERVFRALAEQGNVFRYFRVPSSKVN